MLFIKVSKTIAGEEKKVEDNKVLHEVISGIDFTRGVQAAIELGAYNVDEEGETIVQIASRIAFPLHKTQALISAGLHLDILFQEREKIF